MKLKISLEVSGPAAVATLASGAATSFSGYLTHAGDAPTATTLPVMLLTSSAGIVSWLAAKRSTR